MHELVTGLRDQLAELGTMRKASGRIVRHSVAWRSLDRPVLRERESAEQLDLLAGSCLMLARTAMATTPQQRTTLAPSLRELAEAIADLAMQPGDRPTRQRAAERALELGRWVLQHSVGIEAQSPLSAACSAARMVAVDVMIFAVVEAGEAVDAMHATVEDLQIPEPPTAPRRHWRRRLRSLWPPRRRRARR